MIRRRVPQSVVVLSSIAALVTCASGLASQVEIHVGVIDTGIDFSRPPLNAVQGESWDCRSGKANLVSSYGNQISSANPIDPPDDNGHGTHVAGLIVRSFDKSVAWIPKAKRPRLKISSFKYFSRSQTVSTLEAANCAFETALNRKVQLINYSGGGRDSSDRERDLVRRALRESVPIIAAAGNSAADLSRSEFYPASYIDLGVISVAAVDQNHRLFRYSNFGSQHTLISAQGVDLESDAPGQYKKVKMSGTSQATAVVSGVLAAVLSEKAVQRQKSGLHSEKRSPLYSPLDVLALFEEYGVPEDSLNSKVRSGLVLDAERVAEKLRTVESG